MKSLIKFLFLDIDGVLNSDIYMSSKEYFDECSSLGIIPKGSAVMDKAHHLHINPVAVKLLNSLVEKSGVKVILSSTWRIKYSLEEMNLMFKKRGATFEISGVTPAKMSWRPRGIEVIDYLLSEKKFGNIPEAFVIIDDYDQFPTLQEHFVHTSEVLGLTQENVDQALKILGVEDGIE